MKKFIGILLVFIVIFTCVCAVACHNDEAVNPKEKSNVYYDTITKKLKLTKSYEGKSFLDDGIGSATVDLYTDGDTTRFITAQQETVIIRYFCIDTPESTGGCEKWGKSASNFVKSRLSEATEIVLESSTGGRPVKDSYHVRYLGFVWYKTASYNEFKLLNLELIENGYSDNNDINSPYYNYFSEAERFAKSNAIRVHGEDNDPLYSTDPVPMTIKDFYENRDIYYNEENDSGAKVVFTAYMESLYVSESGTHTFTAATYDPETGEKYTLSVYTAYASKSASNLKIGNLYKITGTIQNYNGKFQVSGINYSPTFESQMEDGTITVQQKYYMTFDSSTQFCSQYNTTLYSDIRVKSASVENGVLTIVGDSNQILYNSELKITELSPNTEEFTLTVKVGENYTNTFVAGDRLKLKGYQFESGSHKILIPSISDITKK